MRISTWNSCVFSSDLHPRFVFDVGYDLALVPAVVAQLDRVRTGLVKLRADLVGDAEAVGGVLAVHDDEIERQAPAEVREVLGHDGPSGSADGVTAKENVHGAILRAL